MKSTPPRWLGLFLISACGVAGYAAGGAGNSSGKNTSSGKTEISRVTKTTPREPRSNDDVFGNFQNLVSGGSDTGIWKIVSRLPKASIPDALRELRKAQAVTSSESSEARRLDDIESALYYHWAEMDPHAALADVAAMPEDTRHMSDSKRNNLLRSVLAAWMRTDANAAYTAVKDHKSFCFIGRDMLVETWTSANVFENLKLFPDKNRDLLGWYCVAAWKDDEQRNAMLKALREQPDMKDRDWGYFMLFRAWAQRDFPAAMAEAKTHDHPGLEEHVFEDGLNSQPAATMRWAVGQNIPPKGVRWENGYRNWLVFEPADAQQWLETQAPVWERSGHTATVAAFRAKQIQNEGLRGGIDVEAANQKLIDLMDRWKTKDPEAAAKWLDTAPEAARKLIIGKGAGSHE